MAVRQQCAKCLWKVSTNPHDIPNGYCVKKHQALRNTIAEPGSLRAFGGEMRMMACHESKPGAEIPCVGWLAHQLGPGNNIALRLYMIKKPELARFRLVGSQHQRFEDTLPKRRRHG